jgi:hypothetical protein
MREAGRKGWEMLKEIGLTTLRSIGAAKFKGRKPLLVSGNSVEVNSARAALVVGGYRKLARGRGQKSVGFSADLQDFTAADHRGYSHADAI